MAGKKCPSRKIDAPNRIGIGDDGQDLRTFATQQAQRARDEERLAVAADVVEQHEATKIASGARRL